MVLVVYICPLIVTAKYRGLESKIKVDIKYVYLGYEFDLWTPQFGPLT